MPHPPVIPPRVELPAPATVARLRGDLLERYVDVLFHADRLGAGTKPGGGRALPLRGPDVWHALTAPDWLVRYYVEYHIGGRLDQLRVSDARFGVLAPFQADGDPARLAAAGAQRDALRPTLSRRPALATLRVPAQTGIVVGAVLGLLRAAGIAGPKLWALAYVGAFAIVAATFLAAAIGTRCFAAKRDLFVERRVYEAEAGAYALRLIATRPMPDRPRWRRVPAHLLLVDGAWVAVAAALAGCWNLLPAASKLDVSGWLSWCFSLFAGLPRETFWWPFCTLPAALLIWWQWHSLAGDGER